MKKILLSAILVSVLLVSFIASPAWASSPGNAVKNMPALYDGKPFMISFMELPAKAEKATELHNRSINTIYQYDAGLATGPFISVLDAIQGDGFNPLWEEFQITFSAGVTPHQFFSDTEILAAVAAHEISLTDTEEMYICTVFGPKKQ